MKAFLDTSSLIKLYHLEEGSDFAINTLSNGVDEIFLSELAILEFRSALWKKVREGKIEETAALEVITCFDNDSDNFRWIPLQSIAGVASGLLMIWPKGIKNARFSAIGRCPDFGKRRMHLSHI